MPVAGLPRNPLHQVPGTRFHRNRLLLMGRDQDRVGRTTDAAPGTIRRLVRGLVGYTSARGSSDFSYTRNDFSDGGAGIFGAVTAPLRYLISTTDTLTAGNQLSNPIKRSALKPSVLAPAPPLTWVGNMQGRPTVRNRMQSFGQRVRPVNSPSPDATPTPGSAVPGS